MRGRKQHSGSRQDGAGGGGMAWQRAGVAMRWENPWQYPRYIAPRSARAMRGAGAQAARRSEYRPAGGDLAEVLARARATPPAASRA